MKRLVLIVLVLACVVDAAPRRRRRNKMSRYYLQHAGTGYVSWSNNSAMIPGTGAFSVSVWLKGAVQLMKAQTGADGWAIATTTNQAITTPGAAPYTTTSTTDLDDGDWHHIVFTRDSSNILYLYVDGSLEDSESESTAVNLDNTNILHTAATDTGAIDDLRFYNGVALSALQVANIYNSGIGVRVKENGFAKITSNGFYSNCDDGSGTTVSGRIISSGTWSDHNGSFTSGDLTWVAGGVPFNSKQLSSDYKEHTFYINQTSKEIQFRFRGREEFAVSEFMLLAPQILDDR